MDPDARLEPLGVFGRVRYVVPVREEDMGDPAGMLEPLHKFRRKAGRVDELVTARSLAKVYALPQQLGFRTAETGVTPCYALVAREPELSSRVSVRTTIWRGKVCRAMLLPLTALLDRR